MLMDLKLWQRNW